jgi:LmbE family N-acetylglucosaminyl deacetylase
VTTLVIAAHPDDEVLGCGGSIARAAADGGAVDVLILGEGHSSRFDARAAAPSDGVIQLQEASRAAARLLGARSVEFGGFADNRFDEMALLDVVKRVEGAIQQGRPDVIYTHHPGDLNIDHGITFRAVLTATRPGTSPHEVADVYAFEIQSSTEWAFGRIEPVFRPTVFVEISDTIEQKIAAMACYESESRPFPHPRSAEALRAGAMKWGSASGVRHAEAFELIRSVRRR